MMAVLGAQASQAASSSPFSSRKWRFKVQGMYGTQRYNPTVLNNYMKSIQFANADGYTALREVEFNKSTRVVIPRLAVEYRNLIWVGAQMTQYTLTNGGTRAGGLTETWTYRGTPLYALLGINLTGSKKIRIDIYGGYGIMLTNELENTFASNNGGSGKANLLFKNSSARPKIVGLDVHYMIVPNYLGIGIDGSYNVYDSGAFYFDRSSSKRTGMTLLGSRLNPADNAIVSQSGNPVSVNLTGFTAAVSLIVKI